MANLKVYIKVSLSLKTCKLIINIMSFYIKPRFISLKFAFK